MTDRVEMLALADALKRYVDDRVPMHGETLLRRCESALRTGAAEPATDREAIAKAIYNVEPFFEPGESVEGFQVSPGGDLTFEQAKARDEEFAPDYMLPILKFAYDAADAVLTIRTAAASAELVAWRCPHDMGFDNELGPLGCRLVGAELDCVCESRHFGTAATVPSPVPDAEHQEPTPPSELGDCAGGFL